MEKDFSLDQMKYFARVSLDNMKKDPKFMREGRRNNDCVNWLIMLNIIREGDVGGLEWDILDDLLSTQYHVSSLDRYEAHDHIIRIQQYLDGWYNASCMSYGYRYAIPDGNVYEID